ncbi:hypothetical protein ANCCEY_09461 [Ancylostoma ceylanicum]|uniref:Uncharacterized protein n=1 Tax=Ancylostoma ceylanicum TaxID=53326 RepID=A0A0D6LHI9_9BILA|nr:hypothetical protein ANCCEY_09461 [Ancylostoma ceylanicum]
MMAEMGNGPASQSQNGPYTKIIQVGELMDTIAEDLQLSDEFATAISQPIGDVHDEDELMKEYIKI